MSEWLDNQKQSISHIRQLLQERVEKANPRRELTTEEIKRLKKLEAIAAISSRGVTSRPAVSCRADIIRCASISKNSLVERTLTSANA